eukprot:3934428-Prymnesium_polylepis.1
MLHSHGLMGKNNMWEESARVPLLLRLPLPPAEEQLQTPLSQQAILIGSNRPGPADTPALQYRSVSSLVDLAPTILGLGGVRPSLLCGGCGGRCPDGRDLSSDLLACAARGVCEPAAAPRRHVRLSTLHSLAVASDDFKVCLLDVTVRLRQ